MELRIELWVELRVELWVELRVEPRVEPRVELRVELCPELRIPCNVKYYESWTVRERQNHSTRMVTEP